MYGAEQNRKPSALNLAGSVLSTVDVYGCSVQEHRFISGNFGHSTHPVVSLPNVRNTSFRGYALYYW